jgi:hypothetical protein
VIVNHKYNSREADMSKKDQSSKPARKAKPGPRPLKGKKSPARKIARYHTPPVLFLDLSVIPSGEDTSLAFDLAAVLRSFFGEHRVPAVEVTERRRSYSITLNEEGVKRLRNALIEAGEEECRKY